MFNFYQHIFSIKNSQMHKIIEIFGVKIKIKDKNQLSKIYADLECKQKRIIQLKKNNILLRKKIQKYRTEKKTFQQLDKNFKHYIVENDLYSKLTKLNPKPLDKFRLEVNIVDHCNLNCKFCDHFSPIADTFYLDIETFERDIKQLAYLNPKWNGGLSLVGGEPLLHKDICVFLQLARKYLPDVNIDIVTNGLLLKNNEKVWKALKTFNIKLFVTTYPINFNYEEIDAIAQSNEILYERFYMFGTNATEKISVHHPFDLSGSVCEYDYINCYHFNRCCTLRNGKIYTCPIIPNSRHFNKYFNKNLKVTPNDYIDIYKVKTFNEILEFCAKKSDFCKYCNVMKRTSHPFGISKKSIEEWT